MSETQKQLFIHEIGELLEELTTMGVNLAQNPTVNAESDIEDINATRLYLRELKEKSQESAAKKFIVDEIMKLPEEQQDKTMVDMIGTVSKMMEESKEQKQETKKAKFKHDINSIENEMQVIKDLTDNMKTPCLDKAIEVFKKYQTLEELDCIINRRKLGIAVADDLENQVENLEELNTILIQKINKLKSQLNEIEKKDPEKAEFKRNIDGLKKVSHEKELHRNYDGYIAKIEAENEKLKREVQGLLDLEMNTEEAMLACGGTVVGNDAIESGCEAKSEEIFKKMEESIDEGVATMSNLEAELKEKDEHISRLTQLIKTKEQKQDEEGRYAETDFPVTEEERKLFDQYAIRRAEEDSDLMSPLAGTTYVKLYDGKGFVELIDMMPRLVPHGRYADLAVVQSARISYGDVLKSIGADNNLIRFLWQNKHSTPFESVSFQFRIRVPIFVARQLMRHRLFSYNEVSYRYTQPKEEFFYPDIRFQDDANRQMSKNPEDMTDEEKNAMKEANHTWEGAQEVLLDDCWITYEELTKMGVAREVARTILPVSLMTEILVKGNLRTFLHFLKLRLEKDAQSEIRDLADAIAKCIAPRVPTTWATFIDCDVNHLDIPGTWLEAISCVNYHNCINECGELVEAKCFRICMNNNGIKGKRKINQFVDILKRMNILHVPITDEQWKELYAKRDSEPTEKQEKQEKQDELPLKRGKFGELWIGSIPYEDKK